MTELGEWPVRILELKHGGAEVVWNDNSHRPQWWPRNRLERLYDWSMDDPDEAEATRSETLRRVIRVRRLSAAERKERKADREAVTPKPGVGP